jgi:hypothetical protein
MRFEIDLSVSLGYLFLRAGSLEIFWGTGEGWKVGRSSR